MSMALDMSYVRSPGLLELEAKLPLMLAGDRGKEVEEAPHFLKLLARLAEKVEPSGRLQVSRCSLLKEGFGRQLSSGQLLVGFRYSGISG